MRSKPPERLPIFRSDLQARLLAALLLEDEALTARQLLDRTEASPASLHRELGRLERAGLVEHDQIGRAKRYGAATGSPLHAPLRALVERTLGVAPLLRETLTEVEGVQAAAIFGSWAAGEAGEASDIDLLVIGEVSRNELLEAVRSVERQIHREIDVTAYRRAEFDKRVAEGSGFLHTVLDGPLEPLIGEVR